MVWEGNFDKLFIAGRWVDSLGQDKIDVISPATEELVASVPSASASDVDRAVSAAREAFESGAWPRMPVSERLGVLGEFLALYVEHEETIAQIVTEEMGCPISLSRTFQAITPRRILEANLELGESYPFRSMRRTATGAALVTREPVGVVAAVTPWNAPQGVIMHKLAAALITGCTMVLKPAQETPLDSYILAELLERAGLPDGVFNVLPAGRQTSELLISHPGIDKVAFTGSTAAGRRIAAICGNDLRRVTLELGGKSAAIFLDDADFDSAVEKLRFGSLRNSGQVCSLKTRLLVSKHREQELLERLVALVDSMPVGDPNDPLTQIGPMVTARQREIIEGYINVGRHEGAQVVVGGGRPSGLERGWYVQPTIFTDVEPGHRIAQEEIFGPVLSVLTFEDEDDAVAIANNSAYGINGAVFTADLDHGLAVASQIRTGTVELNGNPAGMHAPTGGFKASGIGREQGYEGLDSYTEPRAIGLPPEMLDSLSIS
jgi:acyl-CoA reductase-like NAD-dependent aldehyde dehydrogenase